MSLTGDTSTGAIFVEGSYLADGWRYRIVSVVKDTGALVFTGILSYYGPGAQREHRFICLTEYSTIEEARVAAYEKLPSRARTLLEISERRRPQLYKEVPC